MSLFKPVFSMRDRRTSGRRDGLFSRAEPIEPHPASRVSIDILRYHVGSVGMGQVKSTGHDVDVKEPRSATLIRPLAGGIVAEPHGRTALTARAGAALFFSPNRRSTRVAGTRGVAFLGVPVVIPLADLVSAGERLEMSGRTMRAFDSFAFKLDGSRSAVAIELFAIIDALHGEVSRGSRRLLRAENHQSWSRLLCEKFVEALDAVGAIELPDTCGDVAARRHVRRACDFMHAHFDGIITIADVAEVCGVSVRTLEQAFRSVLECPPGRVLVEIRLDEARRRLTFADEGETVTAVALSCGFNHLSRFSASYLARFGELPSETLGRR